MSNVYVIGEQNMILPFRGVGAVLLPVSDRPQILEALNREGLHAEWDGNTDSKIVLRSFDWKRCRE